MNSNTMPLYSKEIKKDMEILKNLIDMNIDAVEFYQLAESKAEDPELKRNFAQLSKIHDQTKSALQRRMQTEGAGPDEVEASTTVRGKAEKMFGNLLATLSSDVDAALISRLEEAEDRCLHSMDDAIKNKSLTPATQALLEKELGNLQTTHDFMRSLKISAKAA